MNTVYCWAIATTINLAILTTAHAYGSHQPHQPSGVVPQSEHDIAASKKLAGPTENKGVSSVKLLGAQDLGSDFTAMQGHMLRAREIIIEPGGVIAIHEHNARPGVAYILEGEIIEHRNDQPQPVTHSAGSTAFETTGVAHWWENRSDKPVRALVVDVLPKQD